MNIQLVRHAKLIIVMDDRTLLIDPMLAKDVGEFMSFLNPSCKQLNPIVPLPADPDLSSVDTAFVTHTHLDHFDDAAVDRLSKDLRIFCQPADEEKMRNTYKFSSVEPIEDSHQSDGIEIFRTEGQHGPGNRDGDGYYLGPVSGFVLTSQNEPTLYVAGDTIYCQEVEDALDDYKPNIVVVNAGAAHDQRKAPAITMTKEDVRDVCRYIPSATVIAVHMEAIDHCLLHRKELEKFIDSEGLSGQVHIPADGESIEFKSP